MTVEDFILLCRLRKWLFTANWIEKRYRFLQWNLSEDMLKHLKNRARNV